MISEVHLQNIVTPGFVALVAIVSASLMKEPNRQQLMAVVMGLAGGVYLNNGFGGWEFPFAIAVVWCAYQGLRSYRWLGIGWLLHTAWDALHHWSGLPMIDLIPTSAFECAVTDVFLALWFFAGAPSVFVLYRRRSLP
jgi:hypothetical protein